MKQRFNEKTISISLLAFLLLIVFSACSIEGEHNADYDLTTEQGLLNAIADEEFIEGIEAQVQSGNIDRALGTTNVGDVDLNGKIEILDALRIAQEIADEDSMHFRHAWLSAVHCPRL